MKIEKLDLKNYRCFKALSTPVHFNPRLNVFAAINGAGKSSLLDAITVALTPYANYFEHGDSKSFDKRDATLIKIGVGPHSQNGPPRTSSIESSYPIQVEMALTTTWPTFEHFKISRELRSANGRTTTKEAKQLTDFAKCVEKTIKQDVPAHDLQAIPVISYYGTGRLHAQKKLMAREASSNVHNAKSRTMGYLNCLSAESTYKHFVEWMKKTTYAKLQESAETFADGYPSTYTDILTGVEDAVNTVLSSLGWMGLHYSVGDEELMIYNSETRYPVAILSDGLRSATAMVADLAYRCVTLNPFLAQNAAKETPGIVLIDEIEMHLHPAWQQHILNQLSHAFPRIQFIVTTHSPQVLSTVKPESIRTIQDNGMITAPTCKTYGAESKRVLEELMGVPSRPDFIKETIREFVNITDKGDWSSETYQNLRSELDQYLGESDPILIEADIKKNFQQLEVE